MSKTVVRITPVGGFDIPGLEHWLATMAGKGLRFSMTIGPLTFFERTEVQTVQIHLEPIRGTANDDPELNALYEDAGWHYWGIFRGSFYVFASDAMTAQAHTPPPANDEITRTTENSRTRPHNVPQPCGFFKIVNNW